MLGPELNKIRSEQLKNSNPKLNMDSMPILKQVESKKFKTKFALHKHEIIHGNKIAKPHSCDICKKSYWYKSLLEDHIKMHSLTKSYICPICGQGYYHMSNLIRHKRIHKI